MPRQNSSGRKDPLGGISKIGDRYLRHLLVVGATAVVRYTRRKTTTINLWANRLLDRKPARLVTVAVANKMARIAWAVMARNENYRSTRSFAANAVRLQLHALAYNLGNLMRTLALPKAADPWSLTSLREKLIKIGAKVVSHGRYVTFQMAEVAVSRQMFAEILALIARLRALPAPA